MKSIEQLIAELPVIERNVEERQPEGTKDNEVANYKCYCCYDYGTIAPFLAEKFIKGHQENDLVLCRRTSDCYKPSLALADRVQSDVPQSVCETLHQINLSYWKVYSENQALKNKAIIDGFAQNF